MHPTFMNLPGSTRIYQEAFDIWCDEVPRLFFCLDVRPSEKRRLARKVPTLYDGTLNQVHRDPRACSTKKARPLNKGERAGFLVTVGLTPGRRVGAYQWGGVSRKHPLSFRPSAVTVW